MNHRTGGLRLNTKKIAADYMLQKMTPHLDLEELLKHPQIKTQQKAVDVYNEINRWLRVLEFKAGG